MRSRAAAFAIAATLCAAAAPRADAATIAIVNLDGPNEGFNDPSPATPEGGNNATTRGAQRLAVFQRAADILGAQLQSGVTIKVGARFDSFNADPGFQQPACANGSGILGFAGPQTFARDFANAPVAGTWYPIALAEARAGANLNGTANEVDTSFNSDVDAACLAPGTRFWYGTTTTTTSQNFLPLLPVVLHELAHGLGFLTLVCTSPSGCGGSPQGSFASGFPDVWTLFLANSGNPSLTWRNMSIAQRAASITGDPNTVWTGANVTGAIPGQGISAGLSNGLLRMHAPAAVQPGSSISHFSSAALPNLLMEPAINSNLFAQLDLTIPLLRDIGWLPATANAAPVITAPTAFSAQEDTTLVLSGIGFADPDAGSTALTVTFSIPVGSGAISVAPSAGVTVGGGATARTLTGTLGALNSALAGGSVSYAPAANANGSMMLTVGAVDAASPPGSDSETVTINIAAVNDPPGLTLPGSIGITEDLAGTVIPVSFADVDAGTGGVVATFSVPAGTLSATGTGTVTVGGTPTARTLAGTIADLNAFLSLGALSYTGAPNANGAAALGVTLNDQGNSGSGGAQSASGGTTLEVTAANDAPTVSAPAALAVQAGAAAAVTPVSYADVDAPYPGNVVATYAAASGTFSATAGSGVNVSGSGSGTLTLTGTLAALNAFLAVTPVQYAAAADATAPVALTLTINDQGNVGGAPLSATATVTVDVTPAGTIYRNGFEP